MTDLKHRITVVEWVIQQAQAMYEVGSLSKDAMKEIVDDAKQAKAELNLKRALNNEL